jgi:hypothetical protein
MHTGSLMLCTLCCAILCALLMRMSCVSCHAVVWCAVLCCHLHRHCNT